jgi:hypothetical protein
MLFVYEKRPISIKPQVRVVGAIHESPVWECATRVWNPFRRNGMESSLRAMHGIAAKRRMESAQRAAWNHTEGVHGITAKGGVLTGAFFVRKYLLTIVRDCVIILGI